MCNYEAPTQISVPTIILRTCTPIEVAVYNNVIDTISGNRRFAEKSHKIVAKETGVSISSVQLAFEMLRSKGFINICHHHRRGNVNRVYLIDLTERNRKFIKGLL